MVGTMTQNPEHHQNQQSKRMRLTRSEQFYAWFVCGLGALFYGYEFYLRILPSVMTQDLMQAFKLSAASLGGLSTFYYLAYTPMQAVVGVLMDRYGPRRLLVFAIAMCVFGSYLFGSTTTVWIAEIGRFLVGFGSAFAFVGAMKLATIWLPRERFAFAAGLITTIGMLGPIIGDNTLTFFVNIYGWKATIFIAAGLGIALAICIIFFIQPRSKSPLARKMRLHIPSLWMAFKGLGRLILRKELWATGLIGCFMFLLISLFGSLWGIPFLETSYHISNIHAGELNSLVYIGWAVGGPIIGLISNRIHLRRRPIFIGALLSCVCILAILYIPNLPIPVLSLFIFLSGAFASAQILVFPVASELSPLSLTATAIALINMFTMFGGIVQWLTGILLVHFDSVHPLMVKGVHVYPIIDYQIALSLLPICMFLAAIIALFLPETHCKQVKEFSHLHQTHTKS